MKPKINQKKSKKETLEKFLPDGTIDSILVFFSTYKVKFKIVKPRKTKLGDFRAFPNGETPEITVNGDLNKYSFLVTTVHEFAHLKTFLEHRFNAQPHGKEWKQNFVELMVPILDLKVLPQDVENALIQSFTNVKASSCTDKNLYRVLRNYDNLHPDEILLEQISKNSTFVLHNKSYKKGPLRRTRFLCEELESGKSYLINALATIKPVRIHEK